jgi:uncharacterized protein YutE (UPF0331/DUF86 family)
MTPGMASKTVISDRADWVSKMVAEIKRFPMESFEEFSADTKNIWAAESCLRRALEALMDIGRHILAKAFGKGISEYKLIAVECAQEGILSGGQAKLLRTLAGYRNRMVHFYHEITPNELYTICHDELGDLLTLRDAFIQWAKSNPDEVDEEL